MTTMRLQGVDLEIRRRGKGPALLIFHGGGGPISHMPFADRLAERFELIEPVHPGYMGSPIPDHFDNLEDLIYLYLDMLDALALDRPIVLGHSLGGWTAAEIAVRNPKLFGKLILANAVGIKVSGRDHRDVADVFSSPQVELNKLAWHDPSLAPDFTTMAPEALRMVASNRIALSMYTWDPYMHNPKLAGRLHRIKVPTLVVWGESDRLVPQTIGTAYQQKIPGARMTVIAKAGHSPHIEQPAAFVQNIFDFAA
jgi:pimeloyl-ACP methyl ester carboxylesterase